MQITNDQLKSLGMLMSKLCDLKFTDAGKAVLAECRELLEPEYADRLAEQRKKDLGPLTDEEWVEWLAINRGSFTLGEFYEWISVFRLSKLTAPPDPRREKLAKVLRRDDSGIVSVNELVTELLAALDSKEPA